MFANIDVIIPCYNAEQTLSLRIAVRTVSNLFGENLVD